jgi:hypothetical protein
MLTAERPSTAPGGDVGVAGLLSDRRGGGGTTTSTERREEAPARPAGADRASRARSTGRSSEAMSTNGGEVDESPWSDGSARRGGAIAPHGGGEARRSSPESGEEVVGDSESPERIRVRERSSEGRVRGQSAGPGWSDQAHSG